MVSLIEKTSTVICNKDPFLCGVFERNPNLESAYITHAVDVCQGCRRNPDNISNPRNLSIDQVVSILQFAGRN